MILGIFPFFLFLSVGLQIGYLFTPHNTQSFTSQLSSDCSSLDQTPVLVSSQTFEWYGYLRRGYVLSVFFPRPFQGPFRRSRPICDIRRAHLRRLENLAGLEDDNLSYLSTCLRLSDSLLCVTISHGTKKHMKHNIASLEQRRSAEWLFRDRGRVDERGKRALIVVVLVQQRDVNLGECFLFKFIYVAEWFND